MDWFVDIETSWRLRLNNNVFDFMFVQSKLQINPPLHDFKRQTRSQPDPWRWIKHNQPKSDESQKFRPTTQRLWNWSASKSQLKFQHRSHKIPRVLKTRLHKSRSSLEVRPNKYSAFCIRHHAEIRKWNMLNVQFVNDFSYCINNFSNSNKPFLTKVKPTNIIEH